MLFTEDSPSQREDRAELERAIARDEEALRRALGDIEHAVRSQISIAQRIRNEPRQALCIAFFAGVALGMTVLGQGSST